MLICWS